MKLTLYTILLLTFYVLYMRNAIDQFLRRSTTIGYRQEKVEKYSAPILIICPIPAFKPSFFKENDLDKLSIDTLFWTNEEYRQKFENHTSMVPIYKNMTHILDSDWEIAIFDFG